MRLPNPFADEMEGAIGLFFWLPPIAAFVVWVVGATVLAAFIGVAWLLLVISVSVAVALEGR